MIKNSLCDDFSKFYQQRLQNIRSNRDAFQVVRQFSSFKRKSNDINNIFLDEGKLCAVSNPSEIANEFASHFLKNHQLTMNDNSTENQNVQDSIDKLEATNCTILFNEEIRANIESKDEAKSIDELLPENSRGILTSMEEISAKQNISWRR